jgi:hypothetical protein
MCSIGLAQLLLLRYQKIPFTSTYIASKDKILVMIILGGIGFTLFTGVNSRIEVSMLAHPVRFLYAGFCFVVLLWRIRRFQGHLRPEERALIFEDRPAPIVQLLNIT